MSMQIILSDLKGSKLLAESQYGLLAKAENSQSFLKSLVDIFEEKTRRYVRVCQSIAKRPLEDAMERVYSISLDMNKFEVVPSLYYLLHETAPDLLTSIGMKGKGPINSSIETVFVGYVARHRLIHSVNLEALKTLCEESDAEESLVFPSYLLNALIIENHISTSINRSIAGKNASEYPKLFAAQIVSEADSIFRCFCGVMYFLGKLLDSSKIPQEIRDEHLDYLKSPETHRQFIQEVSTGYMVEMQKEEVQRQVIESSQKSSNATTVKACLAALPLLGIPVTIDRSAFDRQADQFSKALLDLKAKSAAIEQQFHEQKAEANRQVDAWRASVPDREVTWGLRIGVPM